MTCFNKLITKALIRLRKCAGWSALLLLANHRRQVFMRRGPIHLYSKQCVLSMPKCVLDVSIYMQQTTSADDYSDSFFHSRQMVTIYPWSILLEIHSLYTLYSISRSRSFTESSRRQNASRSCLCYKTAPGTGVSGSLCTRSSRRFNNGGDRRSDGV